MITTRRISALAASAALAGLTACGGGGGSQHAMPSTASVAQRGTATFSIKIPNSSAAASRAVRPQYISPNTQSASISLVSVDGKPSSQAATVVNLTPTSPNCSSATGTLVCTASFPAPAGSDVFSLTMFGAQNATGAQLSAGTVTATINATTVNNVPLTLDGIVSSIVVTLAQNAPIADGKPKSIPVTVTVKDASGATIVGPGNYSPVVTLTNSDTSGHTSLSPTSLTGPGTAVTLTYDGSPAIASQTVTIGATAAGVPPASVQSAALNAKAIASATVSSAAAFPVIGDPSGNVVAILPTSTGLSVVPIATSAGLVSASRGVHTAAAPAAPASLSITPAPDECAPDLQNSKIYCMSFGSSVLSIVSFNPANVLSALGLVGQISTDAGTAKVYFSGAECVVCGIAFDPKEQAIVISTTKGYEFYAPQPGAAAPLFTVTAPVSENFGYNANTDQIYSPYYDGSGLFTPGQGLDVVNVAAGKGTWYSLLSSDVPSSLSEPDGGAVDTSTGIAFSAEEESFPVYLQAIPPQSSAAFVATTQTGNLPGGTVDMPITTYTPSSSVESSLTSTCPFEDYTAADSFKHIAFFGAEYCDSTDYIAAGQLPSTASGTLGFSNYVAAELPPTPTGSFESPLDPHAAVTINFSAFCQDCGILTNFDKSYLAVIDLNKFLAIPTAPAPSGYFVPSSYDLLGKGVVHYIATGVSSAPSAYAVARAAYQRAHSRIHPR